MNYNQHTCDELRIELQKALKEVAEKFEASFDLGKITYSDDSMKLQISFIKAKPGKIGVLDKTLVYRKALETHGYMYGVGLKDLNIINFEANTRFVGIATNRSKYPYVFIRTDGALTLYTKVLFDNVRKNFNEVMSNREKIEEI
jgi:hypothetical protein